MNQIDLVRQQFGPTAAAYATSTTHASEAALTVLIDLVQPKPTDRMVDIATGAGNVALAFAPLVSSVIAVDITEPMLAETQRRAVEIGLENLSTVLAPAELLPFEDASFDIVAVRTAPHHFEDIQASIREMARVVKPDGQVLIVDTCAPEEVELDVLLNAIERLRDPSHVRNYTPTEWRNMLNLAGLTITHETVGFHALGKRMSFEDWTTRMRVSADDKVTLHEMFNSAPDALRTLLEIEADGEDFWFTLPEVTILARPQ